MQPGSGGYRPGQVGLRLCQQTLRQARSKNGADTGTVLAADDDVIRIQTAAGELMIEWAVDEAGRNVALDVVARQKGLAAGQSLPVFS